MAEVKSKLDLKSGRYVEVMELHRGNESSETQKRGAEVISELLADRKSLKSIKVHYCRLEFF